MKETTQNNILLAEFLDMLTTDSEGNIKEDVNSFKFHNDWNWLMLVVERIESEKLPNGNSFDVTIGPLDYCSVSDTDGELFEFIQDGATKIECVYRAVISFIRWHNENKQQ